MNRIVGALDLLLAAALALLLVAAIDCAPEVYRARTREPEDWVGLVAWSAVVLPACASACVAGLILLRGRSTARVTLRMAYGSSAALALLSVAIWSATIATGSEGRIAMTVPAGLFGASAWLLRRMARAAPRRKHAAVPGSP